MKKLFLPALLFIAVKFSSAQTLENTRWYGTIFAPDPYSASFYFQKDTVLISVQGQMVEGMRYKLSGDTLTLNKIWGQSDCNDATGTYLIKIENETLFFTVISDACELRPHAFSKEGYKKD